MEESTTFRVITLNWKHAEAEGFPSTSGIYQAYGDSPIYGVSCLLYIGQSRNLQSRLHQHEKDSPLTSQNNKSYRYAACAIEMLDIAESILIAAHKPSLNAEYLKSPSETAIRYMVQNHGERGVLSLQVTNSYWVPCA